MSKDTLNGRATDRLCRLLRPQDYVEGRGRSPAGDKVAHLLDPADAMDRVIAPEYDASWGLIDEDVTDGYQPV